MPGRCNLRRSSFVSRGVTPGGTELNDVQSQLNSTHVAEVLRPTGIRDVQAAVRRARREGRCLSLAGGRHAMGTQQFGTGNLHLDLTGLDRVEHLDTERGLVTVHAGIMWPALLHELHRLQADRPDCWTIREKQTGVDSVSIGGSLAANIHGRGLTHPPFVGDIESFDLVDARGELRHCSRSENAELFSLAIGGYGLLGVVVQVTLRLVRRFKVRRNVCILPVRDLLPLYTERVRKGFVFGDCQYSIDLTCDAETHPGVYAFYEPVAPDAPLSGDPRTLSREDWARLYRLTRIDKPRAFEIYAAHYLHSEGRVDWSDTHQLAGNFEGHRDAVDARRGTEMITEAYVRHDDLIPFTAAVRADLLEQGADVSYGTIRFIERDAETFLPWARERFACVICNLHVRHTPAGINRARRQFRRILDRVVEYGGSFYLTYHRWATPHHLTACYPAIHDFFRLKREHDPQELFQSDWYRQYRTAFEG